MYVVRASNNSSFLDFFPECLSQNMTNWISAVLVVFNWLDKREIFTTVCRCSANIFSLSLLWCLCCMLRMSSWNITWKHVVSKHQKEGALKNKPFKNTSEISDLFLLGREVLAKFELISIFPTKEFSWRGQLKFQISCLLQTKSIYILGTKMM